LLGWNMEYKATPLEIKAEGDLGVVEGLYSIFGNQDDGGDVMHKGAFTKTIQERANRVKVFFMHLWDRLIAPPPEILNETDAGLFAKFNLVLDSFWGNEAWTLIKAGALTEGSIGYEAVKFDYGEKGIRNLREVKLFEISPVPLGMNPLTAIRAVKAGALPDEQHLGVVTGILEEIKAGRMLVTADTADLRQIKSAFDALSDAINDKLVAAEPVIDHSALLAARFRMAELAMYQLELSH
jgi:HK97 family phage prohead protease